VVAVAADRDLTAGWCVKADDHAHGRGLPAAVRPKEAGDLSCCDGETQIVDGNCLAVTLY
jgi:hypothetical protein